MAAAALTLAGLSGCALQSASLHEQWPRDLPVARELESTPFFPQTAYHCGPAALATAVGAMGKSVDPEVVAEHIFLPSRQGTLQVEMMAGVRREGLVPTRIPKTVESVLREIAAGNPVVVLQNLGLSMVPVWHYAVVVGYDRQGDELVLRSGTVRRERMSIRTFELTWARAGSWAFVALPPGRWPLTADADAAIEAAVGFERVGTPEMALRTYASAVQRWPEAVTLAIGLGNTAYAAGQMTLAADAFSDAAQRLDSLPARVNLARTLLDAGHPRAALETASAAVTAAKARSDATWDGPLKEVMREAEAAVRGTPSPVASERNLRTRRSSNASAVR